NVVATAVRHDGDWRITSQAELIRDSHGCRIRQRVSARVFADPRKVNCLYDEEIGSIRSHSSADNIQRVVMRYCEKRGRNRDIDFVVADDVSSRECCLIQTNRCATARKSCAKNLHSCESRSGRQGALREIRTGNSALSKRIAGRGAGHYHFCNMHRLNGAKAYETDCSSTGVDHHGLICCRVNGESSVQSNVRGKTGGGRRNGASLDRTRPGRQLRPRVTLLRNGIRNGKLILRPVVRDEQVSERLECDARCAEKFRSAGAVRRVERAASPASCTERNRRDALVQRTEQIDLWASGRSSGVSIGCRDEPRKRIDGDTLSCLREPTNGQVR